MRQLHTSQNKNTNTYEETGDYPMSLENAISVLVNHLNKDCDCCKKKCFCADSNCLKTKTIEITLNKNCYVPELKLWEHTFYGEIMKSQNKRIRYVTEDVNDVVTQLDFTEIDDFKIID